MTRVIGAKELEELAPGASLKVPANAVVTPLAMDVIREKRLKLVKVGPAEQAVPAQREAEVEAAEQALCQSHITAPGQDTSKQQVGEQRPDEAHVAAVVEATVKHILAEELFRKTDSPNAIKLAVFGPDGLVLLRALLDEVERCGAQIERLSGRRVSDLFVVAVAVTPPEGKEQEAREAIEEGLTKRQIPPIFGT